MSTVGPPSSIGHLVATVGERAVRTSPATWAAGRPTPSARCSDRRVIRTSGVAVTRSLLRLMRSVRGSERREDPPRSRLATVVGVFGS